MYMYVTYHLMVIHSCAKYGMTLSRDKKTAARTQSFKFDLEVKGQRLMYQTHPLMVIHPRAIYGKPISNQKKSYEPDTNLHRHTDRHPIYNVPRELRLKNSSQNIMLNKHSNLWWHTSAITCQIIMLTCQIFMSSCQIFMLTYQIFMLTCQIFMLTCHLFICYKMNLKK